MGVFCSWIELVANAVEDSTDASPDVVSNNDNLSHQRNGLKDSAEEMKR